MTNELLCRVKSRASVVSRRPGTHSPTPSPKPPSISMAHSALYKLRFAKSSVFSLPFQTLLSIYFTYICSFWSPIGLFHQSKAGFFNLRWLISSYLTRKISSLTQFIVFQVFFSFAVFSFVVCSLTRRLQPVRNLCGLKLNISSEFRLPCAFLLLLLILPLLISFRYVR